MIRFLLPEQESIVGFSTGQFLALEGEIYNNENKKTESLSRFYHPLSQFDDQGFVDFMIKSYAENDKFDGLVKYNSNGGKFSSYLLNLEVY